MSSISTGSSVLSPTAHCMCPQVKTMPLAGAPCCPVTFLRTEPLSGSGLAGLAQGCIRTSGSPQGMAVVWEQAETSAWGW